VSCMPELPVWSLSAVRLEANVVISAVVEHDRTSFVEVRLMQDSFALSVAWELFSLVYHTEQSCSSQAWSQQYWMQVSLQRPVGGLSECVAAPIYGNCRPYKLQKRACQKLVWGQRWRPKTSAGWTHWDWCLRPSPCRWTWLRRCANHHHLRFIGI